MGNYRSSFTTHVIETFISVRNSNIGSAAFQRNVYTMLLQSTTFFSLFWLFRSIVQVA